MRGFAAAGGQVLFGTDVGYMTDYDPTDEYAYLARALTPLQILATLTTAPAARWKESESRGSIDAGKDADLVMLDADPAQDARRFADVRCTIRAGRLIYSRPPPSPGALELTLPCRATFRYTSKSYPQNVAAETSFRGRGHVPASCERRMSASIARP